MTPSRRPPRPLFALLLFSAMSIRATVADGDVGDYSDHDDLDEVVLSCEEAVSALAECCPGFDPHAVGCIDHRYRHTSSCTGRVSEGHDRPEINMSQSKCIRAASCDELVGTRTCERATVRFRSRSVDAGLPSPPAGACL